MIDIAIQPIAASPASLFSPLPECERTSLLTRLPRQVYPARATIVRAGEPSDGLYVLLSGSAKLIMNDPEGRQLTIASLQPGDLFGEIDTFGPQPHTATVLATKPCEVLYVPSSEAIGVFTAHPRAALLLAADLAHRLRIAYAKIASFVFDDVRARVAQALIDAAKPLGTGWDVDEGSDELARVVGASREMVSRVLKQMREAGLISRCGRRIRIVDHEGLLRECARTFAQVQEHSRDRISPLCK